MTVEIKMLCMASDEHPDGSEVPCLETVPDRRSYCETHRKKLRYECLGRIKRLFIEIESERRWLKALSKERVE